MTSLRARLAGIPLLPLVLVGGASLVILLVLSPWLILSPTTPTGGDMGAHVLGPAYLRDSLIPSGRLMGWSNDWFAGFPIFYFYFLPPSLLIVALDLIIPYGVAFKAVTVMGLLAMPPAAYFFARSINLGRSVSLVAASAGVIFVFFESFTIYGGNVASTMAGEFSYSWSFALSLVYLGLAVKAVYDDRRYVPWAALVLALTALTHVLTTIVVVFASLFLIARGAWRTVATWAWGFGIAGFWALPLVVRIGLSSDMAWTPLRAWREIFPIEIWLLLPVAIAGAFWALRRSPRAAPLVAATLLPLIYYPLPNLLPDLLPDLFAGERWKLWNGRLLPYWYFGVAFLAAVGLGAGVVWLSRRLPPMLSLLWPRLAVLVGAGAGAGFVVTSDRVPNWALFLVGGAALLLMGATFAWPRPVGTRQFLTAAAVALLVLGSAAGISFIAGWARWNFEGYEAKNPWPEYEALMVELDRLPEGRVMWENNNEMSVYGTPMALMLIPYWTEGSHKSMEGLFFESSITTPFHFINHSEMSFRSSNPVPGLRYHTFNMDRGVKHMGVYGVDYYVSFTAEATEKAQGMEELEPIPTSEATGPFHLFRLPETSLVEVATHLPSVYEVPSRGVFAALIGSEAVTGPDGQALPSFHDMALDWYEDIDQIHRWVTSGGPDAWPRITSLDQRPDVPLEMPEGAVSDIVLEDHRISFRTEAVGMPHVVKVSYFPNWRATGAEGPWRAAPSLMVVVPTENEVVLEFRDTWAETTGRILTIAGILGLVAVTVLTRRGKAVSPRA